MIRFVTFGIVLKAAFGLLLTAALLILAPVSNHCPGIFIIPDANFLLALADFVPKVLTNLPYSLAVIVLSLTIIDFFLLYCTDLPISNFDLFRLYHPQQI